MEDEEETTTTNNKELDKAAKGVDSVTDYHEDREGVDTSKIDLSTFAVTKEQSNIMSVVIREEDVATLVNELEITKGEAETMLRRNLGNIEKALMTFIRG
jgi:HYPK UBA domain